MCLILISHDQHPQYPLVIAANRDEYYSRPAQPACFWKKDPRLLAGCDLQAGGTWLGVDRQGRFAAVTNYRDPETNKAKTLSRGCLVIDFLQHGQSAKECLQEYRRKLHEYNGFNLLARDKTGFYCLASRDGSLSSLNPGLYGCSNDLIDTPWPKVEKGKRELEQIITGRTTIDCEEIFELLSDRGGFADALLPDTGVGLDLERMLAPVFITSDDYGTRCSTVVLIDSGGKLTFIERSFDNRGMATGTVHYEYKIE